MTDDLEPSGSPLRGDPAVAERHAEWLRLRARGWSYRRIADEFGVHNTTVYEAVKRALAEVKREPAEDVKEMELLRLDGMYEVVLRILEGHHVTVSNGRLVMMDGSPIPDSGPVLAAIDRLLKIQERRSKLLGLDSPAKQDVGLTISYEVVGVDPEQLR